MVSKGKLIPAYSNQWVFVDITNLPRMNQTNQQQFTTWIHHDWVSPMESIGTYPIKKIDFNRIGWHWELYGSERV
jgi:hypothetical protein